VKTAAILAAAVLSLTSCAVEEIVAADSDGPPDAGRHPLRPCMASANCHPDEFCAKASCEEETGGCVRRPIFCNQEVEPSCGCDGFTYFNDCWRKFNRVPSSTPGECDATVVQCGGTAHAACPPPSVCAQLLVDPPTPMCPTDATFNCWVLPPQCGPNGAGDLSDNWTPCGPAAPCVNACNAIRSGVPHYRTSTCP
jgi:hypothetical protein